VLAQERNGAKDEGLTGVASGRHLLEFGRSERPSTCNINSLRLVLLKEPEFFGEFVS
jgi:hypothetical protein